MIDISILEQFDIRATYILLGLIIGVFASFIGIAAQELIFYLIEKLTKSK